MQKTPCGSVTGSTQVTMRKFYNPDMRNKNYTGKEEITSNSTCSQMVII